MEDSARKRGGWLGRAIIVVVVWVALAGGAYYLLVVLPGGLPGRGHDDSAAHGGEAARVTAPEQVRPAPVEWTASMIADRPAAFLEASLARSRDLSAARRKRLDEVTRRKADITARSDELAQSLDEVRNLHARMERAYRQANDEGRWPMKVAGRSFDRARAEAIIAETAAYVESRTPLAEDYAAAVAKIDAAVAAVRDEMKTLDRLRDRMSLDLERVRLDAESVPAGDLEAIDRQLDALAGSSAGSDGGDDDVAAGSSTGVTKSGESFLQ